MSLSNIKWVNKTIDSEFFIKTHGKLKALVKKASSDVLSCLISYVTVIFCYYKTLIIVIALKRKLICK